MSVYRVLMRVNILFHAEKTRFNYSVEPKSVSRFLRSAARAL